MGPQRLGNGVGGEGKVGQRNAMLALEGFFGGSAAGNQARHVGFDHGPRGGNLAPGPLHVLGDGAPQGR